MYKPTHCDQTLTSCQTVNFGVTLTKTIHKQCSVTPLPRYIHDIFFIAPSKHVVTFFRPPGRYFSTSTCISLRTVIKLWRHVKPSILESSWPKLFTNNARSLPYHDISRHFFYCPPKTCSHIFSTPWQIFQYEYMYKPMHCDQTLTSCQTVNFGVKLTKTIHKQCSVTPLPRHIHTFFLLPPQNM